MFQNVVNNLPAPGVAGDFASTNPFSSVLSANGASLVAPAGGLVVGNFFWVGPLGQCSQSYVSGWQIAFLGRNQQALITDFLAESTLVVPEGFMVTGFNGGDFWASFGDGATAGATVYADETTGAPQMQATNSVTGIAGFTGDASFANANGVGQMTLTTVTSGEVFDGDVVTATGVTTGTTVTGLVSGTPNTVGAVYSLSATVTTEGAEAVTTTSNYLLVTAIADGGLSVGDTISGTGVTSGTTITSTPPNGGLGGYGISPGPQSFASATITGPANISTGWKVGPITLAGVGVAKITNPVA